MYNKNKKYLTSIKKNETAVKKNKNNFEKYIKMF